MRPGCFVWGRGFHLHALKAETRLEHEEPVDRQEHLKRAWGGACCCRIEEDEKHRWDGLGGTRGPGFLGLSEYVERHRIERVESRLSARSQRTRQCRALIAPRDDKKRGARTKAKAPKDSSAQLPSQMDHPVLASRWSRAGRCRVGANLSKKKI
ncbi:hypothetical protein LZ32DRAFT_138182 [Colletotrichum eremochloae]|nr:hypothetical protein LZ32DRAFT_138182 [Colletotrichum eremochloae]